MLWLTCHHFNQRLQFKAKRDLPKMWLYGERNDKPSDILIITVQHIPYNHNVPVVLCYMYIPCISPNSPIKMKMLKQWWKNRVLTGYGSYIKHLTWADNV